jgi:hypothetical protein
MATAQELAEPDIRAFNEQDIAAKRSISSPDLELVVPGETNGRTSPLPRVSTAPAGVTQEATGAGVPGLRWPKERNHWIVLDTAWAQWLGVRREAGVYRIRSIELMLRLAQLEQPPTSGDPRATGETKTLTHAISGCKSAA